MSNDVKLSKYLSYRELVASQTASRLGIENKPDDQSLENARHMAAEQLDKLRKSLGKPVIVTSWYRSPALNKKIGGSSRSQHCKGEAIDIVVPKMDLVKLAEVIEQEREYDQLILECYDPESYSGWVHWSYSRINKNRGMKLLYRRNSGYSSVESFKEFTF